MKRRQPKCFFDGLKSQNRPAPSSIPPATNRPHVTTFGTPDEVWLSAAFLYRSFPMKQVLSQDFNGVTEDIGIPFVSVGPTGSNNVSTMHAGSD